MKKFTLFILLLSAWGTMSAQTRDGETHGGGKDFTIRGRIAGLAVGDTVRFERVELPDWEVSPAFDVVVTEPGGFEYSGRQPHIEYLMMTLSPGADEPPESNRRGLAMLVDGGTVTVTGNRDEIYFCRVEGEAFGHQPLLREARELENSIDLERSRYLVQRKAAIAAGDTLKGREYVRLYNEFRRDEDEKRVRELRDRFLRGNPSSPWSVVYIMEHTSHTPLDTLETHYGRLDASGREGYLGTLLRGTIDEIKRLQPGRPAPDFRVTLPDGTTKSSADFRGKYLLIYHWGFCPGSLQLEKEAAELYARFRDRFEVLGITDSLADIREAARTTPPDEDMFGIDLRTTYESMAAHRWIDVETGAGDNRRVGELYAFAGYPYFILVSPDGKIVSRGYHDTFFETKKILEEEYAKKQ